LIVDAHTHLYPQVTEEDAAYSLLESTGAMGGDAVVRILDRFGINKAVVFPPGLSSTANSAAAEAMKRYPDRLIGFGTVHPLWEPEPAGLVEEAFRLGLRGLKIHPWLQGITLSEGIQSRFEEMLNKAAKLGMPVIFHSGTPPDTQCLQYSVLADMFPDVNLIYGHMGLGYFWRDAIRSAKIYDNVYLETSGIQYPEAIRQALNTAGADKLIFGSDLPYLHPAVEMKKISLLKLSESTIEKIMSSNIMRLLPR
jgi:predicted TIM-barrel fold metal-dependent hydrolase